MLGFIDAKNRTRAFPAALDSKQRHAIESCAASCLPSCIGRMIGRAISEADDEGATVLVEDEEASMVRF